MHTKGSYLTAQWRTVGERQAVSAGTLGLGVMITSADHEALVAIRACPWTLR